MLLFFLILSLIILFPIMIRINSKLEDDYNYSQRKSGRICFSIVVIYVVVLFGIFYLGIKYSVSDDKVVDQKLYDIVSLDRESKIHGSFILGTGSIDDVDYYYYYKKVGESSYKLERARALDIVIEESNDVTPQVKVSNKIIRSSFKSFLNPAYKEGPLNPTDEELKNTIVVPKGTIIKEFSI